MGRKICEVGRQELNGGDEITSGCVHMGDLEIRQLGRYGH